MTEQTALIIENTIDWISVTIEETSLSYLSEFLPLGVALENVHVPMQRGYKTGVLYESGVYANWNVERPEMGTHVVFSGQALRWLQARGFEGIKVLSELKRLGGRTSRVDFAIDVKNTKLQLKDFDENLLLPYKGKGRTPRYFPMGTQSGGWTVYIGSRSSEKMLRIYDKAKEQGEEHADWIRIELETKGDAAHWLGGELPLLSAQRAYELCSTIIRGLADFATPDYQSALSATTVDYSIPKSTGKDTLAWLVKSVAPALAKLIAQNPSTGVLEVFNEAVLKELARYGIEVK